MSPLRSLVNYIHPPTSGKAIPITGLLSFIILGQVSLILPHPQVHPPLPSLPPPQYCYITLDTTVLSGPSMSPTFNPLNDVVLVEKFLYPTLLPLRRGDIVIASGLQSHDPLHGYVCKRIIALPGDVVLKNSLYYQPSGERRLVVPEGHVFLEGDNPPKSRDSRHYGPVPMGLVVGRVWWR